MSKNCCIPRSNGHCAASDDSPEWNITPGQGDNPNNDVKTVSTSLSFKDILGAWKARWGIGRMDYTIEPGLYAIGTPGNESPVLVSANYKLTFDVLRKNLDGLDCWLLILDTKGINVWCAAGKGTFGTEELIHRIESSGLSDYVSHKRLILPQLGATGVSAHEVGSRAGYSVAYGPVRADDIKDYIAAGCTATEEMRRVRFTMWDRLVLTPMELVPAAKIALPIMAVMLLAKPVLGKPFGAYDAAALAGAVVSGAVLTPVLLPYIPGRAFAWKGWLAGLCFTVGALALSGKAKQGNRLLSVGHLLLYPAISSFLAMNFTGASTYTSPSGVNKEMKKALPWIVGAAIVGGALTLGVHLFGGRKRK